MTSRAIGWQVHLLDGVALLGGIGEMVSHAKPLPNVKAQGMAAKGSPKKYRMILRLKGRAALADIPCRYLLGNPQKRRDQENS
jgi:hypothetical protein